MKTLNRILDQHLENASSLIETRSQRVFFSGVRLQELEALDRRIIANLEGILLAGADGQSAAMEKLNEWKAGPELFICSMLCIVDQGLPFDSVYTCIDQRNAWGFAEAMSWLSKPARDKWLEFLSQSTDPQSKILINSCRSFSPFDELHLSDIANWFALDQILRMPIRGATLNKSPSKSPSEGPMGAPYAEELTVFHSPNDASLNQLLKKARQAVGNEQRIAAMFLANFLTVAGWDSLIGDLMSNEAEWRLAAMCIGIVGDTRYVPWLIEQLKSPVIGKEAGEAFCMITGARPLYDRLIGEDIQTANSVDEEEDEASRAVSETDYGTNLEFLDPPRTQAWWKQHKERGGTGNGRCLLGKPKSTTVHFECLKTGDQWQRRNSALGLIASNATKSLFDIAAPYNVQAASLASLANSTHR